MMGAVSDRSRSRFGRRRPFILAGTIGDVLFLTGLALSGSYWLLVIFYFFLQTASNTAQGPYQGLQPDVVPEDQRGTASGYYGLANLVGLLGGTVVAGTILAHAGRPAAVGSIAALLAVTVVGLVVLLAILVTWPAARLSDRIGRRPLIVIGGAIATAGVLVLLFAGYRWMPDALLASLAAALGLPELAAQTLVAGLLVGIGF